MTVNIVIQKSTKPDKKYDAVIDDKKTVSFGATGYSDFTIHKDEERKKRYIARHGSGNQDWNDYETAGFWAKHLLWSKPTLRESAKDIEKRFNINVKLKV